MSYTKNWCFTINNPSAKESCLFLLDGIPIWCSYCVWQIEKGEEGTKHVQGSSN